MASIYVGNLPFSATESSIRDLFGHHGSVEAVSLVLDRETGKPRGFGFVQMSDTDAANAIAALNGMDFGGRQLKVNPAQERQRSGGAGYGPRRGR